MANRSQDLRELLRDWPFDPEHAVRIIQGDDGRDVLQVRTPVGIEQFELEGRPDGLRPHNKDSALDFYLARRDKAKAAGEESAFHLSQRECEELFEEGVLYYFRYLHLFHLEDWARTIRDTARNLRLFDFVHRYGHRQEDRQYLEQWRPYVVRINATARAMLAVERHAHDQALTILREAHTIVTGLADLDNPTFQTERERALEALRELTEQIEDSRPHSEVEQLERKLRAAIAAQDFEEAAHLRDRLRALR
jgi:hypothetical protein